MIHGTSDAQTCALVGSALGATGGGIVFAESSWLRSAGEVHSVLGCQIFMKPIRQAIEISEAPISTIHGLMKLEIRNCGMAKETPQTSTAGHTSSMPRKPAKAQISQNGTIREKKGSWRPTMAPRM